MKKINQICRLSNAKFFLTFTLLMVAATAFSQNKRDENWIEDIDYIVKRIEITHPNIYANISETVFKEKTELLKKKVPESTNPEVIIGIWELIASLKDGHTNFVFYESNPLLINKSFNGFPITMYPFADGVYIQAATKKYSESVGKKVIKIGEVPIYEAINRVSKIIQADNKYGVLNYIPFTLNNANILKYYNINNSLSELTLELENENGERETATFKSKGLMLNLKALFRGFFTPGSDDKLITMNKNCSNPLPLWLSNTNDNYWFKYLKEKDAYYLQINKNNHKEDENFTVFINRMFKEFDENKAKKLIIDIRLNDGGQHFEMPLFKGIVSRPELDKPDNLFLLTSRVVYSASQHLTNLLTCYTNATLIGEPTSSKPNFFGSPRTFSPPNNDGLVFRTSSKFFQEVEPSDFSLSTKPDYNIQYNSAHYKNNLDPVFDAVFSNGSYDKLAEDYKNLLKKAFKDEGLNGVKNEYYKFKSEILKNGIVLDDILLTDFDVWMTVNRINDENYIEYLEFLVEEFPTDYLVFYWLANWQNSRNPEKAKERYKKCLELNPSHEFAKMEYELMLLDEVIQ